MIYIENEVQHEKIRKYYVSFRAKQLEVENEETLMYTSISLSLAIKNNVLFDDFLLHPKVVKLRKFYEGVFTMKTKKDVANKIAEVLQYELTCDSNESKISESTIKKLIAAHKRLTKEKKKKNDIA